MTDEANLRMRSMELAVDLAIARMRSGQLSTNVTTDTVVDSARDILKFMKGNPASSASGNGSAGSTTDNFGLPKDWLEMIDKSSKRLAQIAEDLMGPPKKNSSKT